MLAGRAPTRTRRGHLRGGRDLCPASAARPLRLLRRHDALVARSDSRHDALLRTRPARPPARSPSRAAGRGVCRRTAGCRLVKAFAGLVTAARNEDVDCHCALVGGVSKGMSKEFVLGWVRTKAAGRDTYAGARLATVSKPEPRQRSPHVARAGLAGAGASPVLESGADGPGAGWWWWPGRAVMVPCGEARRKAREEG